MKGLFANRSPFLHIGILLFFIILGMLFSGILQFTILFISNKATGNNDTTDFLKIPFTIVHTTQFLSSLFSIFIPALCTAYLCSKTPKDFLFIKRINNWNIFFLVLLMTYLIAPTIELTGYLNANMRLPESMSAIEQWMKNTENYAKEITIKILSEKGISAFFINITVIAIAAAIAEEFLFRGTLLPIIQRMVKNHHAAIWIVAIIFSAIHLQFYGFLPRMLLGAYLGYLLYWSKSIWVPIFAHFLNNATAVVEASISTFKGKDISFEYVNSDNIMTISVLTVIGLILFIFAAKKFKKICDVQCHI